MKLTDQEQIVIKAIRHINARGHAPIDSVIKAVGFPKATTKNILVNLANKKAVALHRHDHPAALAPAQRKRLVRLQDGQGRWHYFAAVSVLSNPMKKKAPVKTQGKGKKAKKALKKTGKAMKGAARALLGAGAQILGAGAEALNPGKGRKLGPRGKTPAKKKAVKRKRNAAHKDSDHPVEVTKHWRAGPPGYLTPWQRAHHAGQSQLFETGIKPAKKRNTAKKRPAVKASGSKLVPRAKAPKSKLSGKPRRVSKVKVVRRNPTASEIRKEFAGSLRGGAKTLYFPVDTPTGELAKLGKLIAIKTQAGEIEPVKGVAWLCCDHLGNLYVGSVKPAPLFEGPARNLGPVEWIDYQDVKKHLGYSNPTIWRHKMGEKGGRRPSLHVDKQGGLIFKGGSYRITTRGIED